MAKGRRITIWHKIYYIWVYCACAIVLTIDYIKYIICWKGAKARIYHYIKEWDGNPISYGYLSKLTKVDEAKVYWICLELEYEKLIDRNETLVWIKGHYT